MFVFIMAYVNNFTGYVLCAVLYGCATGSIFPIMSALAVRFAPINRRGAATATYFSSFDIGIGIGSTIWGFVIDCAGFFRCL
jgi:MFS family permease